MAQHEQRSLTPQSFPYRNVRPPAGRASTGIPAPELGCAMVAVVREGFPDRDSHHCARVHTVRAHDDTCGEGACRERRHDAHRHTGGRTNGERNDSEASSDLAAQLPLTLN